MQEDGIIDEMINRHAIFKIMDSEIIPCYCGAYRKVLQKKEPDLLVTNCSKCNTEESFNIADLTILGGALFKLAIADGNDTEFKPPDVTYEQVCEMIEDIQNHEQWVKEIKGQTLRKELKMLKGGLSK
jgi:hypothetical protein